MAMFQRSLYAPTEPNFAGLFRLIDDWDNYSQQVTGHNGRRQRRHTPVFNPRFDVRETETAYELHGELAGLDKKDISIDFTEPQTVVISGKVERNYTAGTPPTEDAEMSGAIAETAEAEKEAASSHQASVSDEETEAVKEKGEASTTPAATPASEQKAEKPKSRYWQQERSVGEFHRTFTFPQRVDEDAVQATLNNGILTVVVPKAAKHETRRITVD